MSFQGPNYGITNFDNFLHSMLTVFQVCKILQVATKSNRNLSLKNKFAVCNIGGLDWDLVLGEFRFTSTSSSTPALLAFFWAPGSFFLFSVFCVFVCFCFFCPEPSVRWLGAGHERVCVALDLLLLPRPPRRLLYHEPHPRHTLWVRQNLGFSNSPFGESSRNVFCLPPAASPPTKWPKKPKSNLQTLPIPFHNKYAGSESSALSNVTQSIMTFI